MSTLARRRQIPRRPDAEPMGELDVDLARLRAIYRKDIPESKRVTDALYREGEAIIRAAHAAGVKVGTATGLGVPVGTIAAITGLSPQRCFQIINAPTVEDGANGSSSRGTDEPDE